MTTSIKRVALTPLPASRPEKHQRIEAAPVSQLSKALLEHIFSFLEQVKDFYAALRVCKQWEKVVSEVPAWQKLCHISSLNLLFPQLTLSQKKQELSRNHLVQRLDQAQKCEELFRQIPVMRLRLKGDILFDGEKGVHNLKKLLCFIKEKGFEGLKWIDTTSLQITHFPLDEYLNAVLDLALRHEIEERIRSSQFAQLECVEDRFLILMYKGGKSSVIIIIDKASRKHRVLTKKSTVNVQVNFSKFVVWNQAIIFQESRRQNQKFQYQLYSIRLNTLKQSVLIGSKYLTAIPSVTINYTLKENFLCIDWGFSEHPLLVYDKKFRQTVLPQLRLVGATETMLFAYNFSTRTFYRYVFLENQWLLESSDRSFGHLLRFSGHKSFSSQLVLTEESQLTFFDLEKNYEFYSFSFINRNKNTFDCRLIGDYFLFSGIDRNRKKRLQGFRLGDTPSSLAIPIGGALAYHQLGESLFFQEASQFIVYQFENPQKWLKSDPSHSPISTIPLELFHHIFSWVREYRSSLLVSKKWRENVESLPHWKLFRDHFLLLKLLYPKLDPAARKEKLNEADLRQQLEMGLRAHALFQDFKSMTAKGSLFLGPDVSDKEHKSKLCLLSQETNPLNWLDLTNFQTSSFSLSKFLACAPEAQEMFLQKRAIMQLSCIDNRYLVFRAKQGNQSSLAVIDSYLKRYSIKHYTRSEQNERWLSDYTVWNHSIVYVVDMHESMLHSRSILHEFNLETFVEKETLFLSPFSLTPENIIFNSSHSFLTFLRERSSTLFLYDDLLHTIKSFDFLNWYGYTGSKLYMVPQGNSVWIEYNIETKETTCNGMSPFFLKSSEINPMIYMSSHSPLIVKGVPKPNGWQFFFYDFTLLPLSSHGFFATPYTQRGDLRFLAMEGDRLYFVANIPGGKSQLYELHMGENPTPLNIQFLNPLNKIHLDFNPDWGLFVQDGDTFKIYSFPNAAVEVAL